MWIVSGSRYGGRLENGREVHQRKATLYSDERSPPWSLGRMVEKPAIFSQPSRRNAVVNVSSVFMSTSSGCDKAVRSENKSDWSASSLGLYFFYIVCGYSLHLPYYLVACLITIPCLGIGCYGCYSMGSRDVQNLVKPDQYNRSDQNQPNSVGLGWN